MLPEDEPDLAAIRFDDSAAASRQIELLS